MINNMRKVLIGIQCRTNSERLPGKALLKIEGKTIIEHIVKACQAAAFYMNKQGRMNSYTQVALLVPKGDDLLINHMKKKVEVIEGPENDVITRYIKAMHTKESDYVVRITGDCLYITPAVISRHIKCALLKDSDYCNNVLQRCNPEGWDTEVLSRNMLEWLDLNATRAQDREHVTSLIPRAIKDKFFPDRFKIHTSKDFIDLSSMKTSIDTEEDYQWALDEFKTRRKKIEECCRFGDVF